LWLHSLKVAQLLRSAACLHTNQSRSYLNHLVVVVVVVMAVVVMKCFAYVQGTCGTVLERMLSGRNVSIRMCRSNEWLITSSANCTEFPGNWPARFGGGGKKLLFTYFFPHFLFI